MQLVIFNDIDRKNALKGLGSPILLQSPYPKLQSPQVPSGPSQVRCPILSLCFSLLENFLMWIFSATIALKSGWMFKPIGEGWAPTVSEGRKKVTRAQVSVLPGEGRSGRLETFMF